MDKTQVRTAADLEKKYNFAQMLGLNKNVENTQQQLIKVENELNNMLNSLVINLGDLLDSQSSISLYFYDGVPTTTNEPYISWNDPTEHYGDFYYNRLTGYVYKYTNSGWQQQTDTNLINAMALTNVELDVEQDHERKVFFDTPEPPYQNGDWWILEDGTLMICQISKPTGTYEEYDFINSSRYTETIATKIDGTLTIQKGQILIIREEQDRVSRTVTDQNNRISVVEQTVNEINSKISDVVDVTTTAEDTDAQVELDNINASNPIVIKIHPIGENISYDYPHNDYPQNDYSKIRTLKFLNTTTNESFYWELPTDLWWYDADNYDELQLDYGDGTSPTVIVTRKCQINADGSITLLQTPTTEPYPYPTTQLSLTDGDYVVTLLGYTSAYLFVRLMASNIYTTQFATKVELNTAIVQTRDYVDISASAKVGKNEVINRINVSTEGVTINANKINISGVLTAINNDSTTTINGNKITTGTITAAQVSSDIITTTNFSAQNINADNITGGYLNVERISANSITSNKIVDNSITNDKIADNTISTEKINNINAEKITAGTIDANVVNIVNLNASNISGGTINADNVSIINLNADNITAGTLNVNRIPTLNANKINGGTIKGVSIAIGKYFKVSSTGLAEMTTDGGFLTTGTTLSPYVSALNVAYGSGGISFRSSNSQSSAGNQRASISLSSSNGNLVLSATNYVMCGGSGEGYQIATKTGGYPSTKNLKTNIEKIKYDDIYEDMKNMNIYEYDYKYDGIKEKNKHDFGFIIDELEETNTLSKYILNYDRYGKIKGNKLIAYKKGLDAEDFNPKKDGYNFKYKEWDRDTYFKLSLLMIKSLQNKIEKLEEKL